MKVIGITGGIATGKSTMARYLMDKGFAVIDTDKISRDICEPGEAGWQAVMSHFGGEYFLPDGRLDRRKLGAHVFADKFALAALNRLLHPIIAEKVREYINAHSEEKAVFVEGAVIIEAGMADMFDEIWVTVTDGGEQFDRVIARDGLEAQDARNRISAQENTGDKTAYATYVIDTSSAVEETRSKIDECLLRSGLGED